MDNKNFRTILLYSLYNYITCHTNNNVNINDILEMLNKILNKEIDLKQISNNVILEDWLITDKTKLLGFKYKDYICVKTDIAKEKNDDHPLFCIGFGSHERTPKFILYKYDNTKLMYKQVAQFNYLSILFGDNIGPKYPKEQYGIFALRVPNNILIHISRIDMLINLLNDMKCKDFNRSLISFDARTFIWGFKEKFANINITRISDVRNNYISRVAAFTVNNIFSDIFDFINDFVNIYAGILIHNYFESTNKESLEYYHEYNCIDFEYKFYNVDTFTNDVKEFWNYMISNYAPVFKDAYVNLVRYNEEIELKVYSTIDKDNFKFDNSFSIKLLLLLLQYKNTDTYNFMHGILSNNRKIFIIDTDKLDCDKNTALKYLTDYSAVTEHTSAYVDFERNISDYRKRSLEFIVSLLKFNNYSVIKSNGMEIIADKSDWKFEELLLSKNYWYNFSTDTVSKGYFVIGE